MKAHDLRLLVLILLGLSYPTFSQSFYGEVIDADNSEPLQYANIGIAGKNIGGIAFRDGKFNKYMKEAGEENGRLQWTDTSPAMYLEVYH